MRVSALVSAYYAEEYLDKRLNNIKAANAEPIVVCQYGSIELEIAKWHGVKTVVTPDIPTIGAAWNKAIREASGEYLTTANCDDTFKDGGLQLMADTMNDNPDCGVLFSSVDILKGGLCKRWDRINEIGGIVPDMFVKLQSRCFIGPMPVWRKSLHERFGYFDEDLIVSCDYDFWLRLAHGGVNFYFIRSALGTYLKRTDSLEHRNRALKEGEKNTILERSGVTS